MASSLRDVAILFSRLGWTAFGGPAAHIAMMRREVVELRGWLTDQEFLDLLGVTNLIPGPNSTEMAIHLGLKRAGWPGLLVAGACFILPAMLLVLGCAWLYVTYGTLPTATLIFAGLAPIILAIIAQALLKLGATTLKDWPAWLIAGAALVAFLLGVNELAIIAIGGALMLPRTRGLFALLLLPAPAALPAAASGWSLGQLFLSFLKIGSVLYGSGYVLLAFLRAEFVERLGWLTDQQLLDAIAVGQFTPGPVFTTATFVGYVIGAEQSPLMGLLAALVATVGIFLPSFVFVGLASLLLKRLTSSPTLRAVLDGVNAASLGLMAGVLVQLAMAMIANPLLPLWLTLPMAAAALVALERYTINATWLLLAGGAVGMVAGWL